MAPTYKLYYFDFGGRGEPIRLLFSYGKIPFEDIRIPFSEFPSLKQTLPLGQLPVLEIDGLKYVQTTAICRYLANIVGLGGKTDLEKLKIDSVGDTINDLLSTAYKIQFPYYDGEKAMSEDRIKNQLKVTLSGFEEATKQNEGYLATSNLSWVDIFFLTAYEDLWNMVHEDVLTEYPGLKKLKQNLLSQEFIRKWIQKRPVQPDSFFDLKSELS